MNFVIGVFLFSAHAFEPSSADLALVRGIRLCLSGLGTVCYSAEKIETGAKQAAAEAKESGGQIRDKKISVRQFESNVRKIVTPLKARKNAEGLCGVQLILSIHLSDRSGPLVAEICSEDYSKKDWETWSGFLR